MNKPIAIQQGHAGEYFHAGECWKELEMRCWQQTDNRASVGDLFYGPHPRIKGKVCGVCHRLLTERSGMDIANDLCAELHKYLPEWSISPYGYEGASLCIPPEQRPTADRNFELSKFAYISSVVGVGYVVCEMHNLRLEPK